MKKMIFTFFVILFLPTFVFAYSKFVIPGGNSIALDINSKEVIVSGYYKVKGSYINKNIKVSDKILMINNKEVFTINDILEELEKNVGKDINIRVKRNNEYIDTKMILVGEGNMLKTGLYLKDSVVGIGTLTYIDPISKIYGSLGHALSLENSKTIIEVKDGNLLDSTITNIKRSRNGSVGSKKAKVNFENILGNIKSNTNNGIYGFYTSALPNKNRIEISPYEDIKKGSAYILTVTSNNDIKKYDINILEKYYRLKDSNKAFSFEIIDEELIDISGGIVQGMSGSPIIQDNKLIGAVTNVVIDNVVVGYGISIVTMLIEGDKISE